jgi:hypothetical protein
MESDATTTDLVAECEAMGAIDSGEAAEEFVIAYPCRDDAWVSLPLADAAALDDWR